MMAKIQELARVQAAKRNFDTPTYDDIVQDTVVDLLTQHATGKGDMSRFLEGRFLNRATAAVTSWYLANGEHHTTIRGRVQLRNKTEELQQQLGRSLTQRELNDLAEEIRLSFPAGRRPRLGYHVIQYDRSLDEVREGNGDGWSLHDALPAVEAEDVYGTMPTMAAAALESLEAEGGITLEQARGRAWNLIADSSGAPEVAAHSIKNPKPVLAAVRRAGGVAALVKAWDDDFITAEQAQALFAPFGAQHYESREAIVRLLARHPAHAQRLWESAVDAATVPTPTASKGA